MKKIYTTLIFIITLSISAQAPQGFNYQATVRNNAGALMINKNVTFKFNVMKDTPTSVPVFSETHYVPTDDLGAVNLVIGKGTATTGTFGSIDWGTGTYFLGIELNTGNGFIAMGTTQLLSVPYALYAKSSGNAIAPGTVNGQILYWNGTAWVTLAPGANGTNLKLNNGLPVWENSVGSIPSGTSTGQLLYWNGTAWVTLAPGTDGKILRWANGSPTWDSTVPNIVLNEYVFYFNSEKNNQLRLVLRKRLVDDGGERISEQGIYYSQTNPTPTENDLNTIIYNEIDELSNPFDLNLNSMERYEEELRTENLIPGAQYYIRAYAINSKGKGYSDVIRVTAPLQPDTPVLSTPVISEISQLSANATTKTLSQIKEKNSSIIQGFVWDTNPNPTTALDTKSTSSTISGLLGNTRYYIRAFYTKGTNTVYSPQTTFTTLAPTSPSFSGYNSSTVGNIKISSARVLSYVSSDGGSTITQKGIVWSTSPNPTTGLATKIIDANLGNYISADITGLSPSTTYYVRAFATNAIGTSYSNEIVFTTLALSVPSMTISYPSAISQTYTEFSVSNISDGGSTITSRGIVWSSSPNPTVSLTTKSIDTSPGNNFYSSISGLLPATTYYARAFATNAIGTGYSSQLTFTTLTISAPVISNINIYDIAQTSADAVCSNISDGGATITQRGFVWSTSPNPTIALTTKSISADFLFRSTITGLSAATTYYVRAFATNSQGTSYSLETTFTTSP